VEAYARAVTGNKKRPLSTCSPIIFEQVLGWRQGDQAIVLFNEVCFEEKVKSVEDYPGLATTTTRWVLLV
jgi:hypothetical protein